MKRLVCVLLILTFCFSVACAPKEYRLSAEEEMNSVTIGKQLFFTDEDSLYTLSGGEKQVLLEEKGTISQLTVWKDRLYYLLWADVFDQRIISVSTDGTDRREETTIAALREWGDEQIFSFKFYRDCLYVQANFRFYSLDAQGTKKMLCEDVEIYHFYQNKLYYIDHAERTFSVYAMDLTTGETSLILGEGVYQEKETSENLISNFVMDESGGIYYTRRNPDGLGYYDGKESREITTEGKVDEYSLQMDQNDLFFVVREESDAAVYKYNVNEQSSTKLSVLENYASIEKLQNGFLYYLTKQPSVNKIAV